VSRGFVRRDRAAEDRREVFVCLTSKAHKVLRELSLHHRSELAAAGPALLGALRQVMRGRSRRGGSARKGGEKQSNKDGRAA
jgi:DNA-binding MarR family transcriptional regulator